MHQPLFFTHKEGMGNRHSQVVHWLAAQLKRNAVYRRNIAVALDKAVAKAQVCDVWVN